MSQMQRSNPYDPPYRGHGGSEPPDPKDKLKQLQIELDEQNARLTHLNKERDNLQTDIGDLEKTVAEVQATLTDYGGKVKDLEAKLHNLHYFYDQKHKMVMAAIGDKKGPIDELISEFDYEIEKMKERLEELGEKRGEAKEESQKADRVQAEKQSDYDAAKNYKKTTEAKLLDMDTLRTAITQADDATDIASMYFEVLEFQRVLSDTHIVSQHQLAHELKQALGELETAKEHARAKSAAWNTLTTEYDTHEAKLKAKVEGRRQQLLAAVQALYPAPQAATASASGTSATPPTAPAK